MKEHGHKRDSAHIYMGGKCNQNVELENVDEQIDE